MRTIVFDASSLISMSTSCLLWTLKKLKERFNVRFVIPPEVKRECVDNAMHNYRWGLGSERIKSLIESGIIDVVDPENLKEVTDEFMNFANNVFEARGKAIKIIHAGEAELIALASLTGAETICVDEKTMRLLMEKPENLHMTLQSKLHTKVNFNQDIIEKLRNALPTGSSQKVIRSTEIISLAYSEGIMSKDLGNISDGSNALKMALWSLRFAGCSISSQEINDYVKMLG